MSDGVGGLCAGFFEICKEACRSLLLVADFCDSCLVRNDVEAFDLDGWNTGGKGEEEEKQLGGAKKRARWGIWRAKRQTQAFSLFANTQIRQAQR